LAPRVYTIDPILGSSGHFHNTADSTYTASHSLSDARTDYSEFTQALRAHRANSDANAESSHAAIEFCAEQRTWEARSMRIQAQMARIQALRQKLYGASFDMATAAQIAIEQSELLRILSSP